jgi:integrase/recombinase XerC
MLIPREHGTFQNNYEAYLLVSRSIGKATIKNYLSDARLFWGFVQQKYPGSSEFIFNQRILAKYVSWLTGKGFSSNSIARNLSSLRSLVRYLRTNSSAMEPFPSLITNPSKATTVPSFLNQTQITALLNGPELTTLWGFRDACMLEILYSTGLRVSELTQIDRGSLDLTRNEIRVLGKGSKERVVFLTNYCCDLLLQYLERIDSSNNMQGLGDQPLFINHQNGRLSDRSVQRIIKGYARKAGIDPSTHPHTLRHSFATHMLDGGASLTSVQRLLGHSSTRATEVYLHPNLERAREIYRDSHPRAARRSTKNA